MSETDGPFIFGVPEGRVLDQDSGGHAEGVVGNIWGLTPADPWRLRQAQQHFIQANADDFDQQGKDFVDKATGKSYRIAGGDPTVSDNPTDLGITLFFVTHDERLLYLKPLGSEGRTKSVHIGYARSGG